MRSASYTANEFYQYSSRGVPGAADPMELSDDTAKVAVNDQCTYRGTILGKRQAASMSSIRAAAEAL